jgi:hypothetical protein
MVKSLFSDQLWEIIEAVLWPRNSCDLQVFVVSLVEQHKYGA